MKIQKKYIFFGGGASGSGVRVDVNGERRSKVFVVKIQKKKILGGGRGRGGGVGRGSDQGLGWGRWG